MSTAKRVFGALLGCYPAPFRQEYGAEMWSMFDEQLREARRPGSTRAESALWLRAAWDAGTIGPKEHAHVIVQDLRYAFHTMLTRPGFTAVAILTLALGIGANTALFSLWNTVLRASLPGVRDPQELVMLSNPDEQGMWRGRADGVRSWLSYPEFEQMRDYAHSFSGVMAAHSSSPLTWQIRMNGGWEDVRGRLVSDEFFDVLGVHAAIGRVFNASSDTAGTPTAVISDQYWQRRFGRSPDVIGKTFTLRQTVFTIIGVTPRGFVGESAGQQPDLWFPLRQQAVLIPGNDWLHDKAPEKVMWLHVFARLKPGVTSAQAEAEANTLFQSGLASFYGDKLSAERRREVLDQQLKVSPGGRGASSMRADVSQSLTALLAAVGVLLLIACVNLANLLLARGTARRQEMAIRLALGASRTRIARQLVTESLALSAIGGVSALAVAYVLHAALVRMMAKAYPNLAVEFAPNLLIVAFVAAVSVVAGLAFGVLPAWQATKSDAGETLKEQSRGAIGARGQLRSGRLLVAFQLALSLPLLVGAGLLVRTVNNLQSADLGFPTDRLLLLRVDFREAVPEPARRDRLIRELQQQFQAVPGVTAASFSKLGVFSGGESSASIFVEGFVPKSDDDRGSALDVVGPGYFSALGVPLLQGRDVLESDGPDSPLVCVVNEAFAARFFVGRNPIGGQIRTSSEDDGATYQIVGVARNARTQDLRGDIEPRFYVPAGQQDGYERPTYLIRTASTIRAASLSALPALRAAVERVDATLPILSARSLEDQMAPLVAQDRTTAQLALVFGAVALMLASIGLYGVLSYGIARRANEIAIRIALGAPSGRVIGMILRETVSVVAGGLVAGGALAYAGSRLIGSRLYGVAPEDPLTLAVATALLLLVALAAAYLPARRASRVDPMLALHQ